MLERNIIKEEKNYQKYADFCSYMDCIGINFLLGGMCEDFELSFLERLQIENLYMYVGRVKNIYKNSIEAYNIILDNFSNLVKKLNFTSSLEKTVLFSYLLWNGYLSYDNKLSYDMNKILTIPGLFSFDAINGKGTCLTFSSFLSDCLNRSNEKAAAIMCSTPRKVKCDYLFSIDRNIKENKVMEALTNVVSYVLYPISKNANHVVTLIEEQDKLYGFDVTNLLGLNIDNKLNAHIINGEGIYKLQPVRSIKSMPFIESNSIYDKLFVKDNKISYSREELINIYNKCIKIINNNLSLLKRFYEINKEYYNLIHNATIEYGNKVHK